MNVDFNRVLKAVCVYCTVCASPLIEKYDIYPDLNTFYLCGFIFDVVIFCGQIKSMCDKMKE